MESPVKLAETLNISLEAAQFIAGQDQIPSLSEFPSNVTDRELIKIVKYFCNLPDDQACHLVEIARYGNLNADLEIEDTAAKKKLDSDDEKEPIDYLTERAIATSAKPINALLKPIKAWMSEFKSLEEVRDNLPDLYDRLNGDAFMQHLEEYMLLSHLAGQSEVIDESIPEADN